MALKKLITRSNGISVSYHKIEQLRIRKIEDSDEYALEGDIASYVNEDYRREYIYNFVEHDMFAFNVTAEALANPFNTAYTLLKTTEKYAGAEDA